MPYYCDVVTDMLYLCDVLIITHKLLSDVVEVFSQVKSLFITCMLVEKMKPASIYFCLVSKKCAFSRGSKLTVSANSSV